MPTLARCAPLVLAGLLPLAPGIARACGGFFCDLVNNVPVPVDQTGENILFTIDRDAGTVEAHIQIQYTGDPDKFAWIIPVTAEPEFAIGSEILFQNLLAGTVPTYSFTNVQDCNASSGPSLGCGSLTDAGSFDTGTAGLTGGGTDGTSDTDDFQIVKREVVGAYEIVVLKGGTAQELWDWLDSAGYYRDPEAEPIVQEYLDEDFYFAAAKLRHGAGVDEIQPITMTYAGDQPCVPLRLTRIAAVDDMGVRVFALGEARAVPVNYKHVELNEVRIDWATNAGNYLEAVTEAIDEAKNGQAFVTEYAGSSDAVSRAGLFSDAWSSKVFEDREPIDDQDVTVIDLLEDQGLMECVSGLACSYTHPQILPLLRRFLPTPDSVAEDDFYACLTCYADEIDQDAWEGPLFAAQLEERIIAPGRHAVALLDKWFYLSRLLTVISPHEMTVDPEFITNEDLPEVARARTATQMIPCDGSNKMVLPGGHEVLLDLSSNWPLFEDSMPWAARVEQMAPSGAPQVVDDFAEVVDKELADSNARYTYDNGEAGGCSVVRSGVFSLAWLGAMFGVAFIGRRRRR